MEVISTVSGGSIVGAQLYMHLRCLLQTQPDGAITGAHYVNIVRQMSDDLGKVARKNLRTRAFASPWAVVHMISPYYSRTERIAELYDHFLYRDLTEGQGPVRMCDLGINPKGQSDFEPATGNAGRDAKVPVLLINATALNSGHNWRFTPETMGEPPLTGTADMDLDKGTRLHRPDSYDGLQHQQLREFELGEAVAASACVPGLFFPVPVAHMYDRANVQLVDGGVHDNQGVQGLWDEDVMKCDHLIVSDGSGQMDWKAYPATDLTHVLGRSNQVLMQRVREQQLRRAEDEGGSTVVHLRTGVAVKTLYPRVLGPEDHPPEIDMAASSLGGINIDPHVQNLLASIRTDLDSFTKVEAESLLLLGYALCSDRLEAPLAPETELPWADAVAAAANPQPGYLRQLKAARGRWLRPVLIVRQGTLAAVVVVAVIAIAALIRLAPTVGDWLGGAIGDAWKARLKLPVLPVIAVALALGLIAGFGGRAERWPWPFRGLWWFTSLGFNLLRTPPTLALCLFVNVYLRTVDQWVLWRGKRFSGS